MFTLAVVTLTITPVIIQGPTLIVHTGEWREKKESKKKERNIFLFWTWVNGAFCYFFQSDALKEEMFKLNCGFDFPMWCTACQVACLVVCYFSQSDALKEEMFKLNCGFDCPMWCTACQVACLVVCFPPPPLSMMMKFAPNVSSSTHPQDSDHLDCCREVLCFC